MGLSGQREQFFFGHGKVLLTSEYFVLDGAEALALPTTLGQTLTIRYKNSFTPKLTWKSYDSDGKIWFDASFELWRFKCLNPEKTAEMDVLQKILNVARELNPHFLREEVEIIVETKLDFPNPWGLGSSSSLIYNIAQWAYVSPFELASRTFGGSGYDIACAGSMGPIVYQKKKSGPSWKQVNFAPHFYNQLYFIYLGKKVATKNAIEYYQGLKLENKSRTINELSHLTEEILNVVELKEFESLILTHENIISRALNLNRIQDEYFSDYDGVIKSLGAWGGDFALATSHHSQEETKAYFESKGLDTVLGFDELICRNYQSMGELKIEEASAHETLSQ